MNLREALIALAEGKKIREVGWDSTSFLYFDFEKQSIRNDNDSFDDCEYLTKGEWELYEEKEKPIDVLNKQHNEYQNSSTEDYEHFIIIKHIVEYLNAKEKENE